MTRRDFLRSATLGSAAVVACGPYPAAQEARVALPPAAGRVVSGRNPSVWQKGQLSPSALGELLDATVTAHTKQPNPGKAWSALFKPGDRVAIKVNATERGTTHPLLVLALAERLQQHAGVRPDRIVIYDRTSQELSDGGFPVATSGERVRCCGTDKDYVGAWTINGTPVRLSRLLVECDALVNVPALKALSIGGISFASKNHYGSFNAPFKFHGSAFTPGVVELNAMEPIHARTRLIVGDVLAPETRSDAAGYAVIGGQSTLLVSTDPLAIDTVGLQLASDALVHAGSDPSSARHWAMRWLAEGEKRGLGVANLEQITVERVKI